MINCMGTSVWVADRLPIEALNGSKSYLPALSIQYTSVCTHLCMYAGNPKFVRTYVGPTYVCVLCTVSSVSSSVL